MALKSVLGEPDKTETTTDVTSLDRFTWFFDGDKWTPEQVGKKVRTVATTTSTWTAATKQACETYVAGYVPPEGKTAAFAITEENKVIKSYTLTLVLETVTYA